MSRRTCGWQEWLCRKGLLAGGLRRAQCALAREPLCSSLSEAQPGSGITASQAPAGGELPLNAAILMGCLLPRSKHKAIRWLLRRWISCALLPLPTCSNELSAAGASQESRELRPAERAFAALSCCR